MYLYRFPLNQIIPVGSRERLEAVAHLAMVFYITASVSLIRPVWLRAQWTAQQGSH